MRFGNPLPVVHEKDNAETPIDHSHQDTTECIYYTNTNITNKKFVYSSPKGKSNYSQVCIIVNLSINYIHGVHTQFLKYSGNCVGMGGKSEAKGRRYDANPYKKIRKAETSKIAV